MQNLLQKIIKEEIRKILFEEDQIPPPAPADSSSPSSLPQPSGDVNSSQPGSPAVPPTPTDPNAAPQNPADPMAQGAPPTAPGMPAQSPGMSTDLSGGGMTSGGDSGGEIDAGATGDDSGADLDGGDGMDGETPEDPNEKMLSTAKDVIEKTDSTQKALKALKSLIQTNYSEPQEANKFVLDLSNNEQDPRLKDVARRLFLYLTGH